jgi:hypothetical protein
MGAKFAIGLVRVAVIAQHSFKNFSDALMKFGSAGFAVERSWWMVIATARAREVRPPGVPREHSTLKSGDPEVSKSSTVGAGKSVFLASSFTQLKEEEESCTITLSWAAGRQAVSSPVA